MTLLQLYLNSVQHKSSHPLPLTAVSPNLFRQATNSVKNSKDNNDLLEFIGDRAVNLACALLVDKEKVCPDQQIFVGRKICNNDTLGRLAWWLELDEYAALSPGDEHAIRTWSPRRKHDPPPKALADLFESFVGAYCLERGWPAVLSWLESFFKPLMELATEDFLLRPSFKLPVYVSGWWRQRDGASISQTVYRQFCRFLDCKQESLASMGRVAVEAIPLSTKFIFSGDGELACDCDRAEIAHHLISQWICSVYVNSYLENRRATTRAAHLASTITNLVLSDVSLATIASLFSLSSYFDVEDPDFKSGRQVRWWLPLGPSANTREAAYYTKLSLAFQAAVGWYYFHDPQTAQEWGMRFFEPIVVEAYHILVRDPYCRPVLPPPPKEVRSRRPMQAVTNLPRSVYLEQGRYPL